ncbi:MAG: amidohydrolase family protein [Bryobacteraceae bacterium]
MSGRFSRRSLVVGGTSVAMARMNVADALRVNDLDRAIWREELDSFVPARAFDVHLHLTRAEFDLTGATKGLRRECSVEMLAEIERLLMPGRTVHHLIFPSPHLRCDFTAANRFIAAEKLKTEHRAALMVVHPSMSGKAVEADVREHRFLGFKPYRFYSTSGDIEECRITDFLPEHQIAVANRFGLLIGLHLSKKRAISDPQNLDDLERLAARYPRVHWVLFHCARSYSAWALEKAAPRLRRIPNVWIESSSVCETDAFDALFTHIDPKRICYGTDDIGVGITRGKYVAWGRSWSNMDETNQTLLRSHCDGRFTFVRYEMLRAMRRAAGHARFTRAQVEDIFYNNAADLIGRVQRGLV